MFARRAFLVVALALIPSLSWAQGEPNDPVSPDAVSADTGDGSGAERVDEARAAFSQAEYGQLVDILGPLFPQRVNELDERARADARQLYAVGLFFRAQQATIPAQRDELLDEARATFLALLRQDPYFQLDPLLYPASVVEVFESVLSEHSDELEALREKMRPDDGPQTIETVYIQREQERARFALVFFPFAVGQFQNDDLVKGTLLAAVQAAALALNFTSFLVVEGLRNPRGYYCTDSSDSETPLCAGQGDDFTAALAWRNVMYGSLITFGLAYVVSVVDAWVNFEEYDVNIRTLDGPPPELTDQPGSGGSSLPIGFSLHFDW